MSLCCSSYIDLGCFNSCGPIATGIEATEVGTYIVNLQFNGGIQAISIPMNVGEDISIPGPLNENYIYVFNVTSPSGETGECYRFRTKLVQELGEAADACADEACYAGKYVSLLSNIISLTASGLSTRYLDIACTEPTLIDDEGLYPTPEYFIDWGDGSPATSFSDPWSAQLDVNSLADGIYTGTIYGCGAAIEFYYQVQSKVIRDLSSLVRFKLDIGTLTCESGQVDVVYGVTSSKSNIAADTMTVNNIDNFVDNYAPAVDSTTHSESVDLLPYPTGAQVPRYACDIDSITLQNQAALTLKCNP